MPNIPKELVAIEKNMASFLRKTLDAAANALDLRAQALKKPIAQAKKSPQRGPKSRGLASDIAKLEERVDALRAAVKNLASHPIPEADDSVVVVDARDSRGNQVPGLQIQLREKDGDRVLVKTGVSDAGGAVLLLKPAQLGEATATSQSFLVEILNANDSVVATHPDPISFVGENFHSLRIVLPSRRSFTPRGKSPKTSPRTGRTRTPKEKKPRG